MEPLKEPYSNDEGPVLIPIAWLRVLSSDELLYWKRTPENHGPKP